MSDTLNEITRFKMTCKHFGMDENTLNSLQAFEMYCKLKNNFKCEIPANAILYIDEMGMNIDDTHNKRMARAILGLNND